MRMVTACARDVNVLGGRWRAFAAALGGANADDHEIVGFHRG
jgi:hypothetical protein